MSTLNHQYRHFFVHVPKCAGTSMERMPFVGGQMHMTARQLARLAPPDYFGWGFVRNPYDRLVACYHAAVRRVRLDARADRRADGEVAAARIPSPAVRSVSGVYPQLV